MFMFFIKDPMFLVYLLARGCMHTSAVVKPRHAHISLHAYVNAYVGLGTQNNAVCVSESCEHAYHPWKVHVHGLL